MMRNTIKRLSFCLAFLLVPTLTFAANSNVQCVTGSWSSGSSWTASITATTGNLLEVGTMFVASNTGTSVSSITDGTNTYVNEQNLSTTGAGVNWQIRIDQAKSITGGTLTVTANLNTASVTVGQVVVCEVSGANTSSPDDGSTSQNQSSSPGTGSNAVTSGSITTTANGDYVFSITLSRTSGDTFTYGTGYTTTGIAPSTGVFSSGEYEIQASAGSIAGTWTATNGASNLYLTAVDAVKAASGGGGGSPTGGLILLGVGK